MPTLNQNLENSTGMKDSGPWEVSKSSLSSCYLPMRLKKKIPGKLNSHQHMNHVPLGENIS